MNASPSLTANTPEDYALKTGMLDDLFDVVDMEQRRQGDEEHVGGFDLIYDNGYVEVDPKDACWSSYLGANWVPRPRPASAASPGKGRGSAAAAVTEDLKERREAPPTDGTGEGGGGVGSRRRPQSSSKSKRRSAAGGL